MEMHCSDVVAGQGVVLEGEQDDGQDRPGHRSCDEGGEEYGEQLEGADVGVGGEWVIEVDNALRILMAKYVVFISVSS